MNDFPEWSQDAPIAKPKIPEKKGHALIKSGLQTPFSLPMIIGLFLYAFIHQNVLGGVDVAPGWTSILMPIFLGLILLEAFFFRFGMWKIRAGRDGMFLFGRFVPWSEVETVEYYYLEPSPRSTAPPPPPGARMKRDISRPGGALVIRFRKRPWWAQRQQQFNVGKRDAEDARRFETLFEEYLSRQGVDAPAALASTSGEAFRGTDLENVPLERIKATLRDPRQPATIRVRAAEVLRERGEHRVLEEVVEETVDPELQRALES